MRRGGLTGSSLLGRTIPSGERIGTVDRFQGQEAPVVIVSLTTSSSDQIPRGMDFLYKMHTRSDGSKSLAIAEP